jgi:glycine cleavage system aminomethyltransferase T
MSPTLGIAVAMARIEINAATDELTVDVRGKRLKGEVTAMPFYLRNK